MRILPIYICGIAIAGAVLVQSLEVVLAEAPRSCVAQMPSGFDWPADPTELWRISGGISSPDLNIPGAVDMARQRQHGWLLFAGATQPASAQADALPVFHTWYTTEEAFDPTPGKVDCAKRHLTLTLTLPTQLVMVAPNPVRDLVEKNGVNPSPRFDPNPAQFSATGTSPPIADPHDSITAFSHVAFNEPMYDWIRDNQYYIKAALNQTIIPTEIRKPIVDPPVTGISLKFSWWPAAPDALTPVPVWDNDPRFPGDATNPPTTWKRVVVIDPVGGLASPAKVSLGGFDHLNPKVVPLSLFYSVKITAEEAALANQDFRIKKAASAVLGRPLQAGDYLVMTALHIATREFAPWVFTTFWWSDDPLANTLGVDMAPEVKGVFRNYIMDVSYNINSPKTADNKAPIAFNPWLELFQRGGTRSQCMACHARAAYGPKVAAFFNPADMSTGDPNGFDATPQSANDPNFAEGTLDLQRVWTIFTRAQ